jgi:hypothetical protein
VVASNGQILFAPHALPSAQVTPTRPR